MRNALNEKPIIFSGPMVRAILDGRKTQTRRLVKPQPPLNCGYYINGAHTHALCLGNDGLGTEKQIYVPPTPTSTDHRLPAPYQIGQTVWVREKLADATTEAGSRIDLRITAVRVERLQAIKENLGDLDAEGMEKGVCAVRGTSAHPWRYNSRDAYKDLWDSLHRKSGTTWEDNPWVWVYEFERIKP